MAKKKFNISSTLKKNNKAEEVKLAPKTPLKKTVKDPEVIKTKVDEIHGKTIDKVEVETTPAAEIDSPTIEAPKPKAKANGKATAKADPAPAPDASQLPKTLATVAPKTKAMATENQAMGQ